LLVTVTARLLMYLLRATTQTIGRLPHMKLTPHTAYFDFRLGSMLEIQATALSVNQFVHLKMFQ
jgi:hypothetical protein